MPHKRYCLPNMAGTDIDRALALKMAYLSDQEQSIVKALFLLFASEDKLLSYLNAQLYLSEADVYHLARFLASFDEPLNREVVLRSMICPHSRKCHLSRLAGEDDLVDVPSTVGAIVSKRKRCLLATC